MTKIDSPIKIGSFTLKNRITFAPTVKFDFTDDSGKANDKLLFERGIRVFSMKTPLLGNIF